jgi:hypothetical protein
MWRRSIRASSSRKASLEALLLDGFRLPSLKGKNKIMCCLWLVWVDGWVRLAAGTPRIDAPGQGTADAILETAEELDLMETVVSKSQQHMIDEMGFFVIFRIVHVVL